MKRGHERQAMGLKNRECFIPVQVGALRLFETQGQGLVPLECDVIEACRQGVPTVSRGRFRSHDVRFGFHPHGAPAKRPVHQVNFYFYRSSRINPPRAKEKDTARTDIRRAQGHIVVLTLPRNAHQAQRQAEFSASIGTPLLDRAYGMCRNARNALGLGPRCPRWRVRNRCRRLRGQFFNGCGFTAAGFGSVHNSRITSSAHRSPWLLTLLALLADTILRANSSVNSRST